MKHFIICTAIMVIGLPAMANTSTSSTTTTTTSPAAEITTTTTVMPSQSEGATQQSMEEAPLPTGEISSPSMASPEENEPSFSSEPYEQQKMEEMNPEEDEEFVPGSQINDVDEEEEY